MAFTLTLKADQVAELARQHLDSQFRLQASYGAPAVAHVNGDPRRLVGELLRLAFVGAQAEASASVGPHLAVGEVVRSAHHQWRAL